METKGSVCSGAGQGLGAKSPDGRTAEGGGIRERGGGGGRWGEAVHENWHLAPLPVTFRDLNLLARSCALQLRGCLSGPGRRGRGRRPRTLHDDATLDGVAALGVLRLTLVGALVLEAHAGDLQGRLGRGPLRGQGAVHFAPFDPGDGAAGRQSQRAGWGWADARGLPPLTPTRPSWDAGQVGKGRGVQERRRERQGETAPGGSVRRGSAPRSWLALPPPRSGLSWAPPPQQRPETRVSTGPSPFSPAGPGLYFSKGI